MNARGKIMVGGNVDLQDFTKHFVANYISNFTGPITMTAREPYHEYIERDLVFQKLKYELLASMDTALDSEFIVERMIVQSQKLAELWKFMWGISKSHAFGKLRLKF